MGSCYNLYFFFNSIVDHFTLIDEFITEVHRLTFRHLFKLQNDTKACFDRILNSNQMLHSRKFEVLYKICNIYSTTLQNIECRVQTALCTSQQQYTHSITSPIYGTSQGSRSSATHWVFIYVPMMIILKKRNNGCTIISPDKI